MVRNPKMDISCLFITKHILNDTNASEKEAAATAKAEAKAATEDKKAETPAEEK